MKYFESQGNKKGEILKIAKNRKKNIFSVPVLWELKSFIFFIVREKSKKIAFAYFNFFKKEKLEVFMTIRHINFFTNSLCGGALLYSRVIIKGTVYKCSLCGKEFVIDTKGNLVL